MSDSINSDLLCFRVLQPRFSNTALHKAGPCVIIGNAVFSLEYFILGIRFPSQVLVNECHWPYHQ